MAILIWIGAAMAAAGLGGLIWCIVQALRLRRQAPDAETARRRLARLQAANLASVALGFLGLALAAAGVILS